MGISFITVGGSGDMTKAVYDADLDGTIDAGAGGLELDISEATGHLYVSSGTVSAQNASSVKSTLSLGNVENTAISTWAGSSNITTLGTVATGTWNATAIENTKGGTGQDTSGYTGYPYISTGTWSQDTYLARTTNGISVTGASSQTVSLTHDGTDGYITTSTGKIYLQITGGSGASVVSLCDGSSNYLSLTVPSMASDYTMTYPNAVAGATGYALVSTGNNATLGWTASAVLLNMIEDTTPELGGELDCGAHSIGFTQQTATGDGTTTINWTLGNKFFFTFGSQNETFTFTQPTNPCNLLLVLTQDGTGSRLATWPNTVKWPAGTAPTLTTAASAVDIVTFYWDGTNYFGNSSLAFAVPA